MHKETIEVLRRGQSIRSKFRNAPNQEKKTRKKSSTNPQSQNTLWKIYCSVITFWAPDSLLKRFGMPHKDIIFAWREKFGLVAIILTLCLSVGFLTFGLQLVLCKNSVRVNNTYLQMSDVIVNGFAYDVSKFGHPQTKITGPENASLLGDPVRASNKDLSLLFQNVNSKCKKVEGLINSFKDDSGNSIAVFPCVMVDKHSQEKPASNSDVSFCHNSQTSRNSLNSVYSRPISYTWEEINKNKNWRIYNGAVLDLGRLDWVLPGVALPESITNVLNNTQDNNDITLFLNSYGDVNVGGCLSDLTTIGYIDTFSLGCITSNIILYVSLIVILGAVFSKFFMAVYFGWFMSRKLGQFKTETPEERLKRLDEIENWANINNHYGNEKVVPFYTVKPMTNTNRKSKFFFPTTSRYSQFMPGDEPGASSRNNFRNHFQTVPKIGAHQRLKKNFYSNVDSSTVNDDLSELYKSPKNHLEKFNTPCPGSKSSENGLIGGDSPLNFEPLYTLLLVTCYSEGAHGIRTTLDSLAGTEYPSKYKCLVVICDGIIKGEGEDATTPDICLSMMHDFVIPPNKVQEYSYVSIASGSKRHNKAKLYAGYYCANSNSPDIAKNTRTPMVLIVKCGTQAEAKEKKPGNRGKRDSQVILMSFLQRVMFDERMTKLEYEMFNSFWSVTGVTPDNFEIVLMVDADTKVYPDSLTSMVSVMSQDHMVMGLCGETKIANKRDSYTTMMQVFEYYISHHLSKAFESVFGGVTCLPGCFSMYRIKAPKGYNGYWVPILSNPDIVENYSENVVDTLHKKNLLLLGEDRYLSTLMLKSFPKRKMTFVPSAVCKTIVPDEFKVLLSQRRRWINSTVHNLFELVLVNDLCGTFCFSMQFIIFMELVGTLVLPAAITFTLYLVIISIFTRPVPWLPLFLLACILGLPAVLIGLTSRKLVYVGWMLVYLSALFLWNFVLPVYAYWHFDDFSWGETRKVEGEARDEGHSDTSGDFDSSQIIMKRWIDFESDKRRQVKMILEDKPELTSIILSNLHDIKGRHNFQHGIGESSSLVSRTEDLHDKHLTRHAEFIEKLGYTPPFNLSNMVKGDSSYYTDIDNDYISSASTTSSQ
ncbi:Chitin synthase D [Smittium culicis]|uniref:chitin synthase n=1 Tax=Smittium culicis TaxID=133412 RepID=A0A1R1Y7J7_9FUNG|nr:Chitin synthase D [Smittium culicis]OMJ22804.1 Chitin synthase D [Smittium culicis]